MRLDILYFIGYDIDESLLWYSTISRTRQLFPEEVFEQVFTQVFEMFVNKGMVKGSIQTVDSVPIKANANMDSLELKVPANELKDHLSGIRQISQGNKEVFRKAKKNKAGRSSADNG